MRPRVSAPACAAGAGSAACHGDRPCSQEVHPVSRQLTRLVTALPATRAMSSSPPSGLDAHASTPQPAGVVSLFPDDARLAAEEIGDTVPAVLARAHSSGELHTQVADGQEEPIERLPPITAIPIDDQRSDTRARPREPERQPGARSGQSNIWCCCCAHPRPKQMLTVCSSSPAVSLPVSALSGWVRSPTRLLRSTLAPSIAAWTIAACAAASCAASTGDSSSASCTDRSWDSGARG